ncbi:MAG: S8 family serine peptidase [bacterium]
MRRILLIVLLAGFVPVFGLVSPNLMDVMEQRGPIQLIPVDIVLKEQIDIQKLKAAVQGVPKPQRKAWVAEILQAFSAEKQQELLHYLKEMEEQGKVTDIKSFWIHNGIYCRATKDVIMKVHKRVDVHYVDYDLKPIQLEKPTHSVTPPDKTREIAWGVSKVRADQVWSLGYTGQNIVVGIIDTGVNYNHADLASHMWTDPNYPNHGWNFESNNDNPIDTQGHGTHCAGSVASDGTAGSQCGVAPEAQIMACRVRTTADSIAEEQIFSAMQFVVSPPLSPANGGDLISMSLGWQYQWGPRRATWRQSCDNVGVAGIVMCVAAGNERTSNTPPNALRCPGDVPPPWQNPQNGASGMPSDVISVGATDINDQIGSFSSPGPVTWQNIAPFNDYPYPPGLTAPDVSAPGVNIKSCAYNNNTGYLDGWNGTSMATPHTAGVVALMLQKNSDLTPLEIDSILETTAIDLGTAGKDNDFGAGRIDALIAINATPEPGAPDAPTIVSPFDFAKLPILTPMLRFTTTDPQGDDVIYRIYWDTDTSFATPESTTAGPYASGAIAEFVFPIPLTDGITYWWLVKAADTTNSGYWSGVTARRSFTVDTGLPINTCSWFQTTGAQFAVNDFTGTQIQGDSVVLLPVGYVEDTLLIENFETGGIPAGWIVIDGNSDGYEWQVGTTSDMGSYAPPSNGNSYAYYSDDDAGSGAINYNEELISPSIYIPAIAENIGIQYGYGFRVYQSGETYEVKARFFNGTWGTWNTIATYTSSSSGTATIDLTSYLPADSVQFEWMYHDETSSSHWGYACACDNVVISYSYSFSNDQGTLTGVPVYYNDLTITYARPHWGKAIWHKADAQDSIGLQIEYYNGAWQLVPDSDLPGNSSGFYTPLALDNINLSNLDTLTYNTLRLVGLFHRINTEAPNDPALLDWEIGNLADVETVPPEPFSLISPPDSTLFSIPRPTFIWESTVDAGSGLRDYRIYIDNILRHTSSDTIWTADYDLDEGYNDWYVVAYDSANNSRQSNETWIVVIDTTPPSIVNLISPVDSSYLSNNTINFFWHEANDNVSGLDHYILQYALDSGFSQGLVETTLVDTTFTTVLSDTTYFWHVKAVDVANNEGTFSATWQFEVDTLSPSVPALVSPINGVWLADTQVDFEWTAVMEISIKETSKLSSFKRKNITKHLCSSSKEERAAITDRKTLSQDLDAPICYILQVDTTTTFTSPLVIDTLPSTSTTISLSENFYYWRVKAYDLAGNQGPYAQPDSFGIDITPPVIESTTVWTDTSFAGPFEIRTKVTDNLSDVDSVILYYKRNEDPDWISTTMYVAGSPDWYLDSIPPVANPDDTVRYYIEAVDNVEPGNVATDPTGAPTNYFWFIANATGILEIAVIPEFFSFGLNNNPARGKPIFNVAIPNDAVINLRIYDVSGRLIDTPIISRLSAGTHEITWTSTLTAGVYFYSLESPWQNKVGKLVIVK